MCADLPCSLTLWEDTGAGFVQLFCEMPVIPVRAAELVLLRDSKRAATWQRFHCGALLLGREPWSWTPRCVPLLVAAVPSPPALDKTLVLS